MASILSRPQYVNLHMLKYYFPSVTYHRQSASGAILKAARKWITKLDESTARRQLKSPRPLPGRSIHLTLVTKWSWSWSWMTYCHCLCTMSIGPPILRYSYFQIWPWKSMAKVMCVVKVKVTFDLQNSKVKVMVNVKPIGHIWSLEFNRHVYFSFRGNLTTFVRDIGNSIFDIENARSRSWPRSNPMVTFEP